MLTMRLALVVVTGLLAACAGAGAERTPLAGPTATSSPDPASAEEIEFLLNDTYRVGERVDVKIVNHGERAYRYNSTGYEACELTYRDETGREFIIPPGTHCDLIAMEEIAPGETVKLFTWALDECVKDSWGCVEEEPLPPGRYTIEGVFRSADGSGPAHAEASFEIVPAG